MKMVIYMRSLFAIYLMTELARCQDQLKPQCFVKSIENTPRIDREERVREIIEYHVKYRYGTNDTVTDFKATVVANSTRFQPWRWFNVNDNAYNELKLMYDNMFHVIQRIVDDYVEEIEVFVTPDHCLHESNFDLLEDATRDFLMREIHPPNSKTCSAHITHKDGNGIFFFKCCTLPDVNCTLIYQESKLIIIHSVSIIITALILLIVIIVLIHPKLGTGEFYLYPDNMKIKFTTNTSTNKNDKILKVCSQKYCNIFSEIYNGDTDYVVKTVKRIRLLVNKRKCCNESDASISFIRCLRELFADFNSSFVKPKRKTDSSCCSSRQLSSCCFQPIIIVKRIMYILPTFIAIVVLYLLRRSNNPYFKDLCDAYKENNYSCPYYITEDLSKFTAVWFCIFCFIVLLYLILPYNYVSKFICEVKPKSCCSSDTKAETSEDSEADCCSKKCCILCCSKKCCIRILVNFLFLSSFYISWGIIIFYCVYFVIRTILMSKYTKDSYDNLMLLIFPLSMMVADKLMHVTRKYAACTKNIMNLLRSREKSNSFIIPINQENHDLNTCSISHIIKLTESHFINEEFKFAQKDDKENEAAIIYSHSASGPIAQYSFENYFCQLRLWINCPLIFIQPKKRSLISRRLVSLMYSYNNCCRLEINNYLKAAAFSFIPCTVLGILFFLILKYNNMYSYSTEIGGYVIFVLTALKWMEAKITGSIQSTSEKDCFPGPQFRDDLKYKLENFGESWAISNIEFIDDSALHGQSIQPVTGTSKNDSDPIYGHGQSNPPIYERGTDDTAFIEGHGQSSQQIDERGSDDTTSIEGHGQSRQPIDGRGSDDTTSIETHGQSSQPIAGRDTEDITSIDSDVHGSDIPAQINLTQDYTHVFIFNTETCDFTCPLLPLDCQA